MKSHDFHVMMQDILPLCMQHLMEKGCRMAIIHLSRVFKKLHAKIVDPRTMDDLKHDVIVTLEKIPPFFDTMMNLLVHLVEELEICGLMHTCWMYHVEHYMDIERLCEKQSKARRQHGRRLHYRGGIRILHKILIGFYNHTWVFFGITQP
jgi:hypothetical protein